MDSNNEFEGSQPSSDLEVLEELYRGTVLQMYRLGKVIEEKIRDQPIFEEKFEAKEISLYSPYPQCTITEHDLDGAPVYQLSYPGMLPLYFDKSPSISKNKAKMAEWRHYQNVVRDYYINATVDACRLKNHLRTFHHAFMYHCHFFSNLSLRDMDNRNRSILINAARYSRLIHSDDWKHLTTMEDGFVDPERQNHVELFITSRENGLKMVNYVHDFYRKRHD